MIYYWAQYCALGVKVQYIASKSHCLPMNNKFCGIAFCQYGSGGDTRIRVGLRVRLHTFPTAILVL